VAAAEDHRRRRRHRRAGADVIKLLSPPPTRRWRSGRKRELVRGSREALLKGKAQHSWPPCTNKFRLTSFDIANIIYFFTIQAILMRGSTIQSLSLQLELLTKLFCP
jgi:hypothetical protein